MAEYLSASDRVLAAFAEEGVLEREFDLAEFHPVSRFPAAHAGPLDQILTALGRSPHWSVPPAPARTRTPGGHR